MPAIPGWGPRRRLSATSQPVVVGRQSRTPEQTGHRGGGGTSLRMRLAAAYLLVLLSLAAASACPAYYAGGATTADAGSHAVLDASRNHAGRTSHARAERPMRLAANNDWIQSFFGLSSGLGERRRAGPRERSSRSREVRSSRQKHTRYRGWRASRAGLVRYQAEVAYRTVCVRLCDGYFWPISTATASSDLHRDSASCTQSCNSPAALYHGQSAEEEIKDMVNLQGAPYSKLRNAFLYRSTYNADCKCRAHPWEKEATERHLTYGHESPDAAEEPRK